MWEAKIFGGEIQLILNSSPNSPKYVHFSDLSYLPCANPLLMSMALWMTSLAISLALSRIIWDWVAAKLYSELHGET